MHLPEFKDILNQTKTLQNVVQINPISIIGFTKENQALILNTLATGAKLSTALKLAKITDKQFDVWRTLAEKHIEPFYSFLLECDAASALHDVYVVQKMTHQGGWKGAMEAYRLKHELDQNNNKAGNASPTFNQAVQINILDRKPVERKQMLDAARAQLTADEIRAIDIDDVIDG